jgi:hypothetical protein
MHYKIDLTTEREDIKRVLARNINEDIAKISAESKNNILQKQYELFRNKLSFLGDYIIGSQPIF